MIPRGIRLNNPGNIDRNATSWMGMSTLQDDPRFIRFETPVYGLRALMKILLTYNRKYGLDTVRSIINRYAPPSENNTEAYISAVADHVGVGDEDHIELSHAADLVNITQAIVFHENGKPGPDKPKFWYDDSLYAEAAKSALT